MRTLAALLILVAIAARRRSRSVLLRGQPVRLYSLVGEALVAIAHLLGI
ncbi:MAG: hypothetical protein JW963_24415 [Anaerolineales bacterium]|nr:hypothetical protein [Anaerolineales bacterium]